jgi:hypothetical protein
LIDGFLLLFKLKLTNYLLIYAKGH